VPAWGKNADFTRALFYVALSRCETLAELYLILYKATGSMFTKHRTQVAEIEAEYVRLRELPKWRDLQLP
jgi:ATP-dependent exoDNAse (exonuclease V) alpha subunit